ncbi:MAG: hypothetical protein AB7G37_04375 [Solirubrobacteraceae bacterium]
MSSRDPQRFEVPAAVGLVAFAFVALLGAPLGVGATTYLAEIRIC